MDSKVVFIAGGGTGGHIYPGIAIAHSLMARDSSIHVRFVGTSAGLESKIIPREGFPLDLVAGGKLNFQGEFLEKIKTFFKIPIGIIQSFSLIVRYKPMFVLGVGGYASGPFVLAASIFGIPTAIWEPNAHPGLANRILSRFVDRCYVVFSGAKILLKNDQVFEFGMPVRESIENAKKTEKKDSKFHLLSFGGSQGSRAISTVLSDAIIQKGQWTENLNVVHQIGSLDFSKLKEKYKNYSDIVEPFEFIYDMEKYYDWADLVVSRGGASTISELSAFGIVPIIIPLPAADNHQQKNAESLVNQNAGRMILQKDLTVERLIQEIQNLRNNPETMKQMSSNLKKFYHPHSADKIAKDILECAGLT